MQAIPLLQLIKLLCIYVVCNKIGHSNAWRVIIDGFCKVSKTPIILQSIFIYKIHFTLRFVSGRVKWTFQKFYKNSNHSSIVL